MTEDQKNKHDERLMEMVLESREVQEYWKGFKIPPKAGLFTRFNTWLWGGILGLYKK